MLEMILYRARFVNVNTYLCKGHMSEKLDNKHKRQKMEDSSFYPK